MEVAEKLSHLCHTDTEQSNEGITEIEQTGMDLNKAREVYIDLIKMQKMARMKSTVRK